MCVMALAADVYRNVPGVEVYIDEPGVEVYGDVPGVEVCWNVPGELRKYVERALSDAW